MKTTFYRYCLPIQFLPISGDTGKRDFSKMRYCPRGRKAVILQCDSGTGNSGAKGANRADNGGRKTFTDRIHAFRRTEDTYPIVGSVWDKQGIETMQKRYKNGEW